MTKEKKESVVADPKDVKAEMHKEAADKINNVLSEKDRKKFEKVLKLAKMPVEVTDSDFKLAEREVDIRKLSPANKEQLTFRVEMLNSAYLLDISQSLIDLQRCMFALLRKLGVDNVSDYMTETMECIQKEAEKFIKK